MITFDGSKDSHVSCIYCGAHYGLHADAWWDDRTCALCHEDPGRWKQVVEFSNRRESLAAIQSGSKLKMREVA